MGETCTQKHNHQNIKDELSKTMLTIGEIEKLNNLFKAFSDATRVKILIHLLHHEACVCDIADVLNASSSAVSHQLSNLKMAGLVKSKRDGKTIWYSLADDHVKTILDMGIEHINETEEN